MFHVKQRGVKDEIKGGEEVVKPERLEDSAVSAEAD